MSTTKASAIPMPGKLRQMPADTHLALAHAVETAYLVTVASRGIEPSPWVER